MSHAATGEIPSTTLQVLNPVGLATGTEHLSMRRGGEGRIVRINRRAPEALLMLLGGAPPLRCPQENSSRMV